MQKLEDYVSNKNSKIEMVFQESWQGHTWLKNQLERAYFLGFLACSEEPKEVPDHCSLPMEQVSKVRKGTVSTAAAESV